MNSNNLPSTINPKPLLPAGLKPYYEHNGIAIMLGDCREVLPTLETGNVDLVLTDPPYGIAVDFARNSKRTSGLQWGRNGGREQRDAKPILIAGDSEPFDPSLLLMFPNIVLWGANNYAHKLPPSRGWLIWDKREGQTSDDHGDAELAWTTLNQPIRIHRQLWRGIVRRGEENVANGAKFHPAQKPIRLMRWCLSFFPDAQTILDPFMGSGTTLVAAKQLGLRAIGIEIEERYCEIAAKRLAQEVMIL